MSNYEPTYQYIKMQQILHELQSKGFFGMMSKGYERYKAIIISENENRSKFNENHCPKVRFVI